MSGRSCHVIYQDHKVRVLASAIPIGWHFLIRLDVDFEMIINLSVLSEKIDPLIMISLLFAKSKLLLKLTCKSRQKHLPERCKLELPWQRVKTSGFFPERGKETSI
jgi:hypothetical protein